MRWLFTWSSNHRSFTGKFLVSWIDGHLIGSRTWRFDSTYSHNTSQPVFSIPQGSIFNKGLYRESPPEVQLLNILITIFDRQDTPFKPHLFTDGTPFAHVV